VRVELVELGVRHGVRAIAFEKPLALSLADARRIVALCAGGVKAVVCHQLKHAGHWRRIKQIVEEGGIGEIRSFHATARPSMLRVGTHLVDAMLWLGGGMRATSVHGQAQGRLAYLEDHPCPDHVAGVVEFASGVRGFLEIGSLAPRHLDEGDFWGDVAVTVRGARGHARVVVEESGATPYIHAWDAPAVQPYTDYVAYRGLLAAAGVPQEIVGRMEAGYQKFSGFAQALDRVFRHFVLLDEIVLYAGLARRRKYF